MAKIPRTNNKLLHTRIHPHMAIRCMEKWFLCIKKPYYCVWWACSARKTRSSYPKFILAECVPPWPRSIFGQQSVFRRVLGRFPIGRVCSTTSGVNFHLAECVFHIMVNFWLAAERAPQSLGSISDRQSVFRHDLGRFPVVRV